ncbi:MAG: cryptochrome/photolyase family protein [Saprospiraceae bacterium]|nr:cryptochrome/photolyase family protein [Saprospiraceae bacterium]
MNRAILVLPHQLFADSPLLSLEGTIYLIEEWLFFRQYKFHKQKIFFHRSSMKWYQSLLSNLGKKVVYIEAGDQRADIRAFLPWASAQGTKHISYIDPVDDWLNKRLKKGLLENDMIGDRWGTPMFINTKEEVSQFFSQEKESFFHNDFYIRQRKHLKVLVTEENRPTGGKWSFDAANRKKYPRKKSAPNISYPSNNKFRVEAKVYVEAEFSDYLGEVADPCLYPITADESLSWLDSFLETRFHDFGTYEDAIVAKESVLHHSVLTPMLNVGLLTPKLVVDRAINYGNEYDIPINSMEGFVRQIIGWREFIRGIYVFKGPLQRTTNFWKFKRTIPSSFYAASTGIVPVDRCIEKVLKSGYLHHIERLMIMGNFMLLCEFDPDEVYQWFMELFIDAYDWVMVPNVYGMSQFADGGLMATKPYISGSNYLRKMSDFPTGPWQDIWDALFWRFMSVHRSFFESNPRLGLLLKTWDRFSEEKQATLLKVANNYLRELDHQG